MHQLYSLIAHNQHLQDRRHPMFERNKAMKTLGWFFIAFWAAYLTMIGVMTYFMFKDTALEAFDWVNGGMVFFLTFDFIIRFGMQNTPAQNVKQYKLLNIPTSFLLNTFLVRMGLQGHNMFWGFFFVPFGILAIPHFYGLIGLVGFLIGWWLAFVVNSYWYLLWRTLINRNILYFIPPLVIYAALIYFGIFFDENNQWLFQESAHLMRGFVNWQPLPWCIFVAVVVPLFFINQRLQKAAVYYEISKAEQVKKVKTNNMLFLDKFGMIGEYLKLEMKSTIRNQVVRKQFLTGVICMLTLCVLFAFTDVYDDIVFMRIFICTYCFSCLGIMTLTSIMCAEGNYIDGLMIRKETVLQLLKAKYYFHCCILIVPIIFSIMPIVEGKMSIMMASGCMFFASGGVFPFIFQLAVYNGCTINLNAKLTKAGRDTKTQMIMSCIALFLPMIVMYVLVQTLGNDTGSLVMFIIGAIGTLLHPLWLRNIYNRFMQRRYTILDSFRNSRD